MSAAENLNSSWPGLAVRRTASLPLAYARPSTSSLRDGVEEVIPIGIHSDNLSDFPRARPMLDVVLALDGVADVVELLEIHQPLQSISFGETCDEAGAMFEYTADKVARHANIKDTVWAIGQDVNVATCHAEILQDVDGRDKPGHDELRGFL